MMPPEEIRWRSAAGTHVGLVRKLNEDAYLEHADGLWVVADGMGGHTLGDFASRKIVEALGCLLLPDDLENIAIQVASTVRLVNRQLLEEASKRAVPVIGSTVVALFAHGQRCGFLWAGDSRIYLFRDNSLRQLTRDHSQVEELKSRGLCSVESAAKHMGRNVITRAVGAAPELRLDSASLEVMAGDRFLLCSDGLSNEIDEKTMHAALVKDDCADAVKTLLDRALQNGGRDNITVIVVGAESYLKGRLCVDHS